MRRLVRTAGILAAVAALLAGSLAAHDLDIQVQRYAPVIVLKATYSGAEPVSFAAVKIHAPGTPGAVFQSGNADSAGRFAFVPDREGDWRAVVDDELGHRGESRISIAPDFVPLGPALTEEPARARLPLWQRAALGVALIIGFFGFLYGYKARRRFGS
jgi:nickel transport protein